MSSPAYPSATVHVKMKVGLLPKRAFYTNNNIYFIESGSSQPITPGTCDLKCCLFKPNPLT